MRGIRDARGKGASGRRNLLEGSRRQTLEPANRNCITEAGILWTMSHLKQKSDITRKVFSYMQRLHERKTE
ncbi:MAG: hypothetical protein CRN43_16690 [Candidatus Nephrothrix sp. EaCA]|nr:MAG: hypothetical protein CRN43_16690 [Candidatus Nephrothrix sp. EaCA]